ncbi:MAG: M20/M25/M40 family metallo-hydrolase, partial [Romboutsia sp.]|nr:M20/M25/M40 family metallo-hydrolase [Romboutsia sp.]
DITMEVLYSHDCSNVSDTNSDSYKYLCKSIKEVFPDVNVAPYIMLAGTDSRHYCDVCDCVIRFAPLKLNNQQLNSPHGINENVSIDSLVGACEFYRYFIQNYGK